MIRVVSAKVDASGTCGLICGKHGWAGPHGISAEDLGFLDFAVFGVPRSRSPGEEAAWGIAGVEDI